MTRLPDGSRAPQKCARKKETASERRLRRELNDSIARLEALNAKLLALSAKGGV